MKRWALVVVALYFLILIVITSPLIMVCFYPMKEGNWSLALLTEWLYWVVLGVSPRRRR